MGRNTFMSILFYSGFAFLAVVALTLPVRKVARLSGIVDVPEGRKQHAKEIPPVGGLVLFTVFMLVGVWSGITDLSDYSALYVGLIMLLVSGAIDDQSHIRASLKFIIHIFVACFVVFLGGVQATYLGDLFGFGAVALGGFAPLFSIAAVVLLVNAMNFVDGMDGLAAGMSSVMFIWFAIGAVAAGLAGHVQFLMLLLACISGFLVFNMRNPWRRKASLFLGDAGSLSLGLVIAWFAVHLAGTPAAPFEPITVAWIIGFPIFDICAQFYRRVSEGKHPFTPDRGHFHHCFIDAGVSVRYATPIIMGIVAVMGAIGYGGVLLGLSTVVLTVTWVGLLFGHMTLARNPRNYVRFIKASMGFMSRFHSGVHAE